MLTQLIVLVEEPSMEAMLEHLLGKILGKLEFQIIRFQCKDDLLKQLPVRLRAYSAWLPATSAIIVLVDRDNDNCIELKKRLENISQQANLISKTQAGDGKRFQVANRIAIEELESWFFGDWAAVKTAYPRVPISIPQKAPFRHPDAISGGTWEALERVLQKAGYFKAGLRKIECARSIAPHMDPTKNHSTSFNVFYQAIITVLDWE